MAIPKLITAPKKGLWIPKHLKTNYTRQGTPELGSGQELVRLGEIMPLMDNDEEFKAAVELMARVEGHAKAVQVLHRGGELARSHEAEHTVGERAYERKAKGALDDTKTLTDMGVNDLAVAQALGVST